MYSYVSYDPIVVQKRNLNISNLCNHIRIIGNIRFHIGNVWIGSLELLSTSSYQLTAIHLRLPKTIASSKFACFGGQVS